MRPFILKYTIEEKITDVFPFFAELEKYKEIHQSIDSIKKIGDNAYEVKESFKLGFIPMTSNHTVHINYFTDSYESIIHFKLMDKYEVELKYYLNVVDNNTTKVEEQIYIHAPWPIDNQYYKSIKANRMNSIKIIEDKF